MFLFYVLSFFKKGDTIQGGTLFKGGHYLRKYGSLHENPQRLKPFDALDLDCKCTTNNFCLICNSNKQFWTRFCCCQLQNILCQNNQIQRVYLKSNMYDNHEMLLLCRYFVVKTHYAGHFFFQPTQGDGECENMFVLTFCTVPIDRIISIKNARACVSMDFI